MQTLNQHFLQVVYDPQSSFGLWQERIKNAGNGHFVLCAASSAVSEHDGVSAAGIDPYARRLTPAIDAEALVTGKAISAHTLPVSPRGIVSPVVITRSALQLLKMETTVVDCGCYHAPCVPVLRFGDKPANCLSTGQALELATVKKLFEQGQELGERLSSQYDYLILAECVPGGTTTALGLLTALDYKVHGLVSNSLPRANHDLRWLLVQQGLHQSGFSREIIKKEPLISVAALGDPMQPVVAGICLAALRRCPVVLAGGSQMLAIYALLKALLKEPADVARGWQLLFTVTTKWVAFDTSANSYQLARLLGAPLLAACPDFTLSCHPGLQAYEEGNVKEGVGAGAAMAISYLKGFSPEEIMQTVDAVYDEMVVSAGSQEGGLAKILK